VGTGFSLYGRAQLDSCLATPGLAIWWLRHACPGSNDALTGDLIERFREGQTRGWFWRQVLIAFIVSVLGEVRRHWPHFCYAIVGTPVTLFFWDAHALRHVPGWFHWNELPWPWSQLAFELSRPAFLALAALSVLAAGLVIQRSFRWVSLIWVSLLRTGVFNLALIALVHYSIELWLLGGHPVEWWCMFFSTFLVAAWLGCVSPRRAREFERQAM
jgi:hypothetical protein